MVYLLFESKTKKMNKLRVSIIPFNLKIQQEWAFSVCTYTPGTLQRNFLQIYAVLKKPTRAFCFNLKIA